MEDDDGVSGGSLLMGITSGVLAANGYLNSGDPPDFTDGMVAASGIYLVSTIAAGLVNLLLQKKLPDTGYYITGNAIGIMLRIMYLGYLLHPEIFTR